MPLEKTNLPGYVKDSDTQLVTNRNDAEYKTYLKQREKILEQQALEDKINTLENQVSEIHEMLKKIADKV
jgi:hypothetical protein